MNKQKGLQFFYFFNQKQTWLLLCARDFFLVISNDYNLLFISFLLVSCHHHHSHQDQPAGMLASITETTSVLLLFGMLASITETTSVLLLFTCLLLPWSDLLYHIEDYITVGVSSCAAGKKERRNDNHPPHTKHRVLSVLLLFHVSI